MKKLSLFSIALMASISQIQAAAQHAQQASAAKDPVLITILVLTGVILIFAIAALSVRARRRRRRRVAGTPPPPRRPRRRRNRRRVIIVK